MVLVGLSAAATFASLGRTPAAESSTTVTPPPTSSSSAAATLVPESLRLEIVETYPHDPDAFTQGLVYHRGRLFESTGLHRRSSLREVEFRTGRVVRKVDLDDQLFGEGLALVGDALVQLTWQNGKALRWDLASFRPRGEHRYEGEGWGLCFDGRQLVMSDGSDTLSFRDSETFALKRRVRVTKVGLPVRRLNELECVDGVVYANIWERDEIVRIDPASGRVTASIDASGLLPLDERRRTDVLNGIAYVPARKTFLLTGKLWPKLFEVRFVPK